MLFSVIVKVLDLGDIFPFVLDDISICIYCKGVMATTSLVLRTSLVVLIFFVSLAKVDEKLLILATKYISRRNVNRFSLFKVFLLFFCRLFPRKHSESISRVSKSDCTNIFAFTLMAFLMAPS